MLSGEAARAELGRYAAPEGERARGVRVHTVFAARLAGDIVATLADDRRPWWPVALQLDELSPGKREKVLRALAPQLGGDLARWWDWSAQQPYQRGWQRRAYRSQDRLDSLHARWGELGVLLRHSVEFPQPVRWHAEWALHLSPHLPLGALLASAIAHGDADVARIVTSSIRGEHAISGPSRHAFVALLSSPDPAGWSPVERLLVEAQREEGLRQSILEVVDLAHPDALARVLDVVVEHGLARFAATVRALGVWIGEPVTVRQERQVAAAMVTIRDHLRRPPHPEELVHADPVAAFLGVWSLAVRDVHVAIPAAERLLGSRDERTRLAAARLLADFAVPATGPGLASAVRDPSLPVHAAAVSAWPARGHGLGRPLVPMPDQVWATLRDRVGTLGEPREVQMGLIGHLPGTVGTAHAADVLISHHGDRPLDPAIVAGASADGRWVAAWEYALDPAANRAALFALLADRSARVRDVADAALRSLPWISQDEARFLEQMLTRRGADLRATALSLLASQDPAALEASIRRLGSGTAEQRSAAAELGHPGGPPEQAAGDALAALRFTVADRTPAHRPTPPAPASWQRHHDRCRLVWTSLGAWLSEHADVEVHTGSGVELLANVRWIPRGTGALPLPEVLGPWWERIAPQLTDGGVEVALLACVPRMTQPWAIEVTGMVVGPVASELAKVEPHALQWAVLRAVGHHARRDSWADPVLSFLETAAAALPVGGLRGPDEVLARRGRRVGPMRWGVDADADVRTAFPVLFGGCPGFLDPVRLTDAQVARLWRALRFLDEPEGVLDPWTGPTVEARDSAFPGLVVPDQPHRWSPPTWVLVEAVTRGVATRADLIDAVVLAPRLCYGPSPTPRGDALRRLSAPRPEGAAAGTGVQAVVSEVRAAVVAAEVTRGDLPTALSETAQVLRTTYGAEQLVSCVAALGPRPFTRAYASNPSRESSVSHLVRVNQPLPGDTAQVLGQLASAAGISERRLIETAVYAPQWSRLVEEHLGWPGLESGVWWVHAHTKDDGWALDPEIVAQWAAQVSQRTPLDATDLVNGAADVTWFREMIDTLGEPRFTRVLKAAKYASSSGGHKRAELFAAALLSGLDDTEVVRRIRDTRHQDSVRALGLLPLTRDGALLDRYELLRGFVASDRTSGSQRRASETTAVQVGLDNLARTAGFGDPQRLVWAMEAEAVRDLAAGPLSAVDGDLTVTLALDDTGTPQLSVHRAGRPLKAVPAASAKVPGIAELRDRAAVLRTQIRRMRASLESACVLADPFDPDELAGLLRHPILAPMLRDLVLVDSEGLVGFPLEATTLVAPDGTAHAPAGALRIAHPVDLLASGEWPQLQHAVMTAGRQQPFKQLFRELYTPNDNERAEDGVSSRRYAGHQLDSRRAAGIFTSRGWVADIEAGFSRTFHQQRITAWCHLVDGWGTPTEVSDPTIDSVTFHRPGQWHPVALADVPARVFSETMRDLDLVVSVAHASGVDPQASESSLVMRGRLVDETTSLLGMTNVEVGAHHVRVRGTLGTYSIHLGSGVVHRIPGNAVCIVAVSAQHRGRVFLPFADDDPRTAEIVAKVVLLARDDKIKDPTILQQLVR